MDGKLISSSTAACVECSGKHHIFFVKKSSNDEPSTRRPVMLRGSGVASSGTTFATPEIARNLNIEYLSGI